MDNFEGVLIMSITTRKAKNAEIALVKEISLRTEWERISEDQKRELNKDKWSRHMSELFDTMVKKESHEIFVAEDENQALLGYVWVGEGINGMTGIEQGFIYDIFARARGLMLMEKAERYCKEAGYNEMRLMVDVNNQSAQKLYLKQGFKADHMLMLEIASQDWIL